MVTRASLPLPCAGGTKYQRLSGSLLEGTDQEEAKPWTFNPVRFSWWVFSWAIPGVGMFLEGYFIFRCASAAVLFDTGYPAALLPIITNLHIVSACGVTGATIRVHCDAVWSEAAMASPLFQVFTQLPTSLHGLYERCSADARHAEIDRVCLCCSIGNITPLLDKEYPNCWKKYTSCAKTLTEARCARCASWLNLRSLTHSPRSINLDTLPERTSAWPCAAMGTLASIHSAHRSDLRRRVHTCGWLRRCKSPTSEPDAVLSRLPDSVLHSDCRHHHRHDHRRLCRRPHRPQVGLRHHRLDHVCE